MIGGAQRLTTGQDDMEIKSTCDEYCKHDPEKEDHYPGKSH